MEDSLKEKYKFIKDITVTNYSLLSKYQEKSTQECIFN